MTAVILAAGIASRLRPLTDATPKCLLPVAGTPLLQRMLEALRSADIRRCLIVTGYLHHKVEAFVTALHLPMDIEFIHNPAFEHTNNNYSLWLTQSVVGGREMLLLDADILFHRQILRRLLDTPHPDALVIRAVGTLGHEEIKCELDAEGALVRIGKHLDPERSAGESLGIEKFSARTSARLFDVLARRHIYNEFYEASFQELIAAGVRIYAVDAGTLPCVEIDTAADLVEAEKLAPHLDT